MSLFDYPRINITGTVQLSPGTANNDDLSTNDPSLPLYDSANVAAFTYGKSDADFRAWVQQPQPFTNPPPPLSPLIPAEWNYYGDASSTVGAGGTSASVVAVVAGSAPGDVYLSPSPSAPVSSLVGASLTYDGCITDLNTQGSPPATQFFIPQLTLANGSTIYLQGPASKGVCQYINFFRNVNATADQGAGGYIYHVLLKSECSTFDLPGFDDPSIIGAIYRTYFYNGISNGQTNDEITALYQKQQQNPIILQFVATIAPLFASETITTGPVGRLLAANENMNITTPPWLSNNGQSSPNTPGTIYLAPAIAQTNGNIISVDFVNTFPDAFEQPPGPVPTTQPPPPPAGSPPPPPPTTLQPYSNDKWPFGTVTLMVNGNGNTVAIDTVDYTDTDGGNALGWIFDYDISQNTKAQSALTDPNVSFTLVSEQFGEVLSETEYFFVTNQVSIYAEQNGPTDSFLNQGTMEPATVTVYSRGVELSANVCPPISVWSYATVPMQMPGPQQLVERAYKPGTPLSFDTSQPGNFNFIFTIGDTPPATWNPSFLETILMTNSTSISLRVLPNSVDFTPYHTFVNGNPVGNSSGPNQLLFSFVYTNVLQVYYLLFPAMDNFVLLNSETSVNQNAQSILNAINLTQSNWMSPHFMPRTRDMSQSRRTLLQAYCNLVTSGASGSVTETASPTSRA
ncbi:MAG: hypothetical protein QOE82_3254 [Thermoanaerobaculia bacterium]|jgi:hypothetical protein|nr:hypothetical protein [Thermoanaerobaculia bacterium]